MIASAQWATRPDDQRFETLADLAAAVRGRRMRSRSVDLDLSSITAGQAESGGIQTIALNHGIKQVEPSHWAFSQMAGWIHAPADYLRRLPAPLAVQCINEGIKTAAAERGALKFMTVSTADDAPAGTLNTLQAVTSTTYGRIWDADSVDCVSRIVERSGGKFHNPLALSRSGGDPRPSGLYASDHDVFMFMIDGGSILEAGPRAELNRGFIVSNSETGARTFNALTFLFNKVCGNHIIWGAKEVRELKIRHTSGGPTRFDTEAVPLLRHYCEMAPGPEVEVIKRAQAYMLPSGKEDEVITWLREHGKFSNNEAREAFAFAKSEEGDCRTLWQAVQGLTAYARGFDWIDSRIDLETRAGKLLEIVA